MLQQRSAIAGAASDAKRNGAGTKRPLLRNSLTSPSPLLLEAGPPSAPFHLRRVLVVDDSPGVCAALAQALARPALRVCTARTTQEAFVELARETFDLVIAEFGLSPLSGIGFLEQVRSEYPQTRRVLITGGCDVNVAREAINRSGVCFFLCKPWDAYSLTELVRSLLEDHEPDLGDEGSVGHVGFTGQDACAGDAPESAELAKSDRIDAKQLSNDLEASGAFEGEPNQGGPKGSGRAGSVFRSLCNVRRLERSQSG